MPALSCPVCRGRRPIPYIDLQTPAGKITYLRCPDCTLVFQDPNAPFKAEDIYNADYIQKRSQDPASIHTTRPRKKTAEHYYRWIEKSVARGNLLEVGCATGLALKVARDQGWNVFGIEVNDRAAAMARDVLKADVIKAGHLNKAMFPDNYFSLVTLFDVIEHIPRPLEFLSILNSKTAPGGKIFFVTPNVDTLSFKILKNKWPHFVQEHLLLFSPRSMHRLLKEAGFELLTHGWATKYLNTQMLKVHAQHHPNPIYKAVSWALDKNPWPQAVFPFNVGEMFILAEKIA